MLPVRVPPPAGAARGVAVRPHAGRTPEVRDRLPPHRPTVEEPPKSEGRVLADAEVVRSVPGAVSTTCLHTTVRLLSPRFAGDAPGLLPGVGFQSGQRSRVGVNAHWIRLKSYL